MRISFFVDSFPATSETFILQQITGLIDLGHEVNIIALSQPANDIQHQAVSQYQLTAKTTYLLAQEARSPVKRLLTRSWQIFTGLFRPAVFNALCRGGYHTFNRNLLYTSIVARHAAGKVATLEADIIVVHFGPAAVLADKLRDAGVIKGKLAAFFHGYDLSNYQVLAQYKAHYRQLFNHSDIVLPISCCWHQKLLELGCPANKIQVHRMGIAATTFSALQHDISASNRQSVKLLSVARLTEKKGLQYMIKAAACLRDKGYSLTYTIIGSGPLLSELTRLIADNELTEHVFLVGSKTQQDVMQALTDTDIFVLPSVTASNGDSEGIPVSLMEAMAAGKLCISTYHSGIPELITDNVNGFLVSERDEHALLDKLIHILHHPQQMPDIRLNAQASILEHYNADKLNKTLATTLARISAL